MTLSIVQKLKIALVKTVINIIWMFDVFAGFVKKNLLVQSVWNLAFFSFLLLMAVFPLFRSGPFTAYKKWVSIAQNEFTTQVYGDTRLLATSVPRDILGATSGANALVPTLTKKSAFPYLSAQAYLVIDNTSGKILSQNNTHMTFAPASTTKMMTALVARDLYDFDDVLMIPEVCSDIDSTKLYLPIGDYFSVEDLISSLLISSAADSGCTLAVSQVGMTEFVERMNAKAKDLGMVDTSFTNPIGLDGEEGSHYSTVWDLYLLSQAIMRDPKLRNIVRTKDYSFTNLDGSLDVNISSTNRLLWEIPGSVGIKTGHTSGAGDVLVYRFVEGNTDLTIIVMASADRFLDTRNLLDWTLSSYSWN